MPRLPVIRRLLLLELVWLLPPHYRRPGVQLLVPFFPHGDAHAEYATRGLSHTYNLHHAECIAACFQDA